MHRHSLRSALGGIVLAVAVTVALTACGADDTEGTGAVLPDQTVDVRMTDIAFAPIEIVVDAGRQIRLVFRNDGALSHDFTIAEMPHRNMRTMGGSSGGGHAHSAGANAIHLAVDPGTEATLDLETTETGRFEFFCSVAGHREAGMAGSFTVQ